MGRQVVWYGFHPLHRYRLRKIPGPPSQWLFGNLKEFRSLGQHGAYELWARYGPVYKVRSHARGVRTRGDGLHSRQLASQGRSRR